MRDNAHPCHVTVSLRILKIVVKSDKVRGGVCARPQYKHHLWVNSCNLGLVTSYAMHKNLMIRFTYQTKRKIPCIDIQLPASMAYDDQICLLPSLTPSLPPTFSPAFITRQPLEPECQQVGKPFFAKQLKFNLHWDPAWFVGSDHRALLFSLHRNVRTLCGPWWQQLCNFLKWSTNFFSLSSLERSCNVFNSIGNIYLINCVCKVSLVDLHI